MYLDPTYTWLPARSPLELMRGGIHLWRVDLDRHVDAVPVLERTLGPDELAKPAGFRLGLHRNRYILAHAALRSILARYPNGARTQLEFRYTPQGKPELAGGALHFSMSHSHDLALCAISLTCHIGVDVERVGPGVDQDFAGCLSRRARQVLAQLSQLERRNAFFRGWTRMEAVVKAAGQDLEVGLRIFELFLDRSTSVVLPGMTEVTRESRWWLYDFSPRAGYVGALAAPEVSARQRWWQWRPEEWELQACC